MSFALVSFYSSTVQIATISKIMIKFRSYSNPLFISPEYFLSFSSNLYISPWLRKSFKFMMFIFTHASKENPAERRMGEGGL